MVLCIEGRVTVSLMFRGDWKLFHMHEMDDFIGRRPCLSFTTAAIEFGSPSKNLTVLICCRE